RPAGAEDAACCVKPSWHSRGWGVSTRRRSRSTPAGFNREAQSPAPMKQDANPSPQSAVRLFAAGRLAGDATVAVDGHAVALTSLDRVYFPEAGLMKGDLLRYYHRVAPVILPYLR